jgi:16S rRNA (uracil1498-N3)-methyltransferase
VAIAACKQCECPYLPECADPAPLDKLLESGVWDAVVIAEAVYDTRNAVTVFMELLALCAKSVLLLVGPEGGFTKAEYDLALSKGALPTRIGPYVLRTEHAACVLSALARNILGAQ